MIKKSAAVAAVAITAAMACLLPQAHAQQSAVRDVAVIAESDGPQAQRLGALVTEGIRKSSSMRYQDAAAKAQITVRIATMSAQDAGSIVYSATWVSTRKDALIDRQLATCDVERIAACADAVVAKTDTVRASLAGKK
ncbi:hypothetical protein PMI14_04227 [Acidovorax sp. CF316]|uniref:hypothetical protein n=1 Tax=Acidovorax sp. CF316 TaxID=1144317 RepID=UPI00026BDF2C|nr:hypothetical protein [Acidovorax sp. CF316]EJE51117.1 hypothetical protein PMI14_04227 [Acidovorax sp. CF316]